MKYFFSFSVIVLLVLLVSGSFYRFVVLSDFTAAYEGDCDPTTESCYEGCEDEECTEFYYYSLIERKADEIYALCGPDVLECDEAYECQEGVEFCQITFCNPAEDECAEITGDSETDL